MAPVKLTRAEFALAGLDLFPPSVREEILSDRDFRLQHGVRYSATIKFAPSDLVLSREAFLDAIRKLLARNGPTVIPVTGSDWSVALEGEDGKPTLVLIGKDGRIEFEPYFFLSPDPAERLAWFDKEIAELGLETGDLASWRSILAGSQIENDDVEPLLNDLRLAPVSVRETIAHELRRPELRGHVFAPRRRVYYERLIGTCSKARFEEFAATTGKETIGKHLKEKTLEGLKAAIAMSAHSNLSQLIDLKEFDQATVAALYTWLEQSGDLNSRLGGIEIGLAALNVHPQLEKSLLTLCRDLAEDNPEREESRWKLFNSLFVLIESELAKAYELRTQPPYWRRLAAMTQTAIVEREVLQAGTGAKIFNDWIEGGREFLFYCQTLVDLRQEPRWLPDFAFAEQWRAEFLGRIYGAACKHDAQIKSAELRELLLGQVEGSVRARFDIMRALLPGPLEGGVAPLLEMPEKFHNDLQTKLQDDTLTPLSFAALTNAALMYRLGPNVAQVATDALKRARHDLRKVGAGQEVFSLLSGLAITAAVTRNRELADQVRVLARGLQRRLDEKISLENMIRIAVIAAASRDETQAWNQFVGDWLTEMAFEDISKGEANVLATYIGCMRHFEPLLWRSCAKAMAACNSLLAA